MYEKYPISQSLIEAASLVESRPDPESIYRELNNLRAFLQGLVDKKKPSGQELQRLITGRLQASMKHVPR